MTTFTTSHGVISVENWGYRLQGSGGAALTASALAATDFDLLVTDFSRDGTLGQAFTPAEITALKTNRVVVSYISIGEASDFRSYWNDSWTTDGSAAAPLSPSAPSWLGPTNPAWPESRKVRYWDPGWQNVVFNDAKTGWLDKIVAQGFDAAYLDIVDAYYYWGVEAPAGAKRAGDPTNEKDAAQRMIDFIVDFTAHARATNPNFFVILQNGAFIIDALAGSDATRKAALLDAIGAIAVEDVYLRDGSAAENNGFAPDEAVIAVLKRDFLANGKAVFAVDYVNQLDKMGAFLASALEDGFIPTVAPTRSLDRVMPPLVTPAHATALADLVVGSAQSETIDAKGGNDTAFGFAGNDLLLGRDGNDVLAGGAGQDTLRGGAGADTLNGADGADWADYSDAVSAISASLLSPGANTGIAAGDRYTAIENLLGSRFADRLSGNSHANKLHGGAGRDILQGLGGNDTYYVDTSADIVRETAGAGTDSIYASVSYTLSANSERLILTGTANIAGTGTAGNDVLTGNAGDNVLRGAGGSDRLWGGAGRDTFLYRALSESSPTARDVIGDFRPGTDRIDVSAIDANGAALPLDGIFTYLGTRSFDGRAGELRVRYENPTGAAQDKTIIEADCTGDRKADFTLELTHILALSARDFVL